MQTQSMPRATLFITGATGFLGSHFVYANHRSGAHMIALTRGADDADARRRVLEAVAGAAESYRRPLDGEAWADEISACRGDITLPGCGLSAELLAQLCERKIDELWHFAASLAFEDRKRDSIHAMNVAGLRNTLELARALGVRRFLYVSTAYTAGAMRGAVAEAVHAKEGPFNNYYEETKCAAEHEVTAYCREHGIDYRIFRPSIVVGPRITKRTGGSDTGLYGFVREIYNARKPLRSLGRPIVIDGNPDTELNLIPVDDLVADMNRVRAGGFEAGPVYHVTTATGLPVGNVVGTVCELLDVPRAQVGDISGRERSPLESLIDQRTVFYNGYMKNGKRFERVARPIPGLAQDELAGFIAESVRVLRAEVPASQFERLKLSSFDHAELSVYARRNGARPTLVLVNANGMPVEFWSRFVRLFRDDYDILTWETRGVPNTDNSFPGDDFSLEAQVADLEHLLAHFAVDRCHLVGWCTGAQLAMRVAAARPEKFASVSLLNGTYNLPPSVPKTAMESHLRTILPRIASSRRFAEMYHRIIYGNSAPSEAAGAEHSQGTQSMREILAATDADLVHLTSLPYQSPEAVFRYARLTTPFFESDVIGSARALEVKTLVATGKKDRTSHYAGSLELARALSHAELYVADDGDHFSLYRDDDLAMRVKDFIQLAA